MQQLDGGILGDLVCVVKRDVMAVSDQLSACDGQIVRPGWARCSGLSPPLCVRLARGRVREGASSLLIFASSR